MNTSTFCTWAAPVPSSREWLCVSLVVVALGCKGRGAEADESQDEDENKISAERPVERLPADGGDPPDIRPVSYEGMIEIPAGPFLFGCNEELDDKCSDLERRGEEHDLPTYYIDETPVVAAAYARCVDAGVCTEPKISEMYLCTDGRRNFEAPGRERHPINCVTWEQAYQFCLYQGKRLPTEKQWEKAARGTDGRIYPWGNEPPTCRHAVSLHPDEPDCHGTTTHEVGSRPSGASPYGVLDMAGNVREWTLLEEGEELVPAEGNWKSYRTRGGGFLDRPHRLRVSSFVGYLPREIGGDLGFRCVAPAP